MQTAANNNLVLTDSSSLKRFADLQTTISFGGFYHQIASKLVKDVYRRRALHDLGEKLVVVAERAHALRQMDALDQLSRLLVTLPLPRQYEAIGQYYQALCIQMFGRGDLDQAAQMIAPVAESGPDRYRARALISLGANSINSGDNQSALSHYCDGHRVKRTDPDNTATIFVYNVGGQLIGEYTSGTPSGNGTSYLTTDHLGSTRVVTSAADGSGNVTVKARYDYLPFGEEIGSDHGNRTSVTGYGSSDKTRQKFTQKERDNESGLDYFLARYYSSAQGRFTSVDPGPHSLKEPQVWNRYAYTANDPLNFIDPDGEFSWGASLGGNLTDQQLRKRATDATNLGAAFQNLAIIAQRNAFRNALTEVGLARDHFAVGSRQRAILQQGLDAYGTENDGRGPRVQVARTLRGGGDTSPNGGEVRFTVDSFRAGMGAQSSRVAFASAVAHEGTHVYNNTHGMYSPAFQNELSAFRAQSLVIQARDPYVGTYIVWGPQQKHLYSLYWRQDPQGLESKRTRAIIEYMRSDPLYQRLVPSRK